MITRNVEGLQRVMNNLNNTAQEYGMQINKKKTKVMKISRSGEGVLNIMIQGEEIEQVSKFKYLGHG